MNKARWFRAGMSTAGPAMKAARALGQGWKVSPYVRVQPKETFVMADVKGEGAIQQIWLTPAGNWRTAILRFYWDGEPATNVFTVYYQINYTLTDVPDDAAYFHAQFRRVNPLPYKDVYTILDGVKGWGHHVGTYMAWGVNNNGWWGEGEIKFYMDGDTKF